MLAADRFTRWLVFSVMVAITPLSAKALQLWIDGAFTLERILIKGELLLVCAVLAADAAGVLFLSGKDAKVKRKLWAGGGCIIIVFLCSALYAHLSTTDTVRDGGPVATASFVLFGTTLLAGGSCAWLAEGKTT